MPAARKRPRPTCPATKQDREDSPPKRQKSNKNATTKEPRPSPICTRIAGVDNESPNLQLGNRRRDRARIDEVYRQLAKNFGYKPSGKGQLKSWVVPRSEKIPGLVYNKYTFGSDGARILAVLDTKRPCAVIWAVIDHDGDYRFRPEQYQEIISLWERGETTSATGQVIIDRPEPVKLPSI